MVASTAGNFTFCQQYDANWLFGTGRDSGQEFEQNILLVFENDSMEIRKVDAKIPFLISCASISDAEGELLFSSNGIAIYNPEGTIIENGDSLNPGFYRENWERSGYIIPQISIALPFPGDNNRYLLLHKDRRLLIRYPYEMEHVFYESQIEKSTDSTWVTHKNRVISYGSYSGGGLTACRHGNGRDWWVVLQKYDSNEFEFYLLDTAGIRLHHLQQIGISSQNLNGNFAKFSPNGVYYARIDFDIRSEKNDLLSVYEFDRCEGIFTEVDTLRFGNKLSGISSIAFSPNSEFLYVTRLDTLIQININASNIFDGSKVIGVYDDFQDTTFGLPFIPTKFYRAELAPDNKIYINSNFSTSKLHVINSPNLEGTACDFQQHKIQLPAINSFAFPNFPNYNLKELKGSACDTISTSSVKTQQYFAGNNFKIFPNPTNGEITISTSKKLDTTEELNLRIINVSGRVVIVKNFEAFNKNQFSINLKDFLIRDGLYFLEIRKGNLVLDRKKIIYNGS